MAPPEYPFWGTKEQRAEFLTDFRWFWQIHPDVELTLSFGSKVARWHVPMRINGRRFHWNTPVTGNPFGIIVPTNNGWNPQMSHPRELREWLAIPDDDFRAVNRANIDALQPQRRRSVAKVLGVIAFCVVALIAVGQFSARGSAGLSIVLILVMARVIIATFSSRLLRNTPYVSYEERKPADSRRPGGHGSGSSAG